jgi:4-diphosphocytidyl-2-C-methyl-D-erythritol kinase
MYVTNYLNDVVVWAPAKVNLFLEVLGKQPDGYHDIATLMVGLRLFDTLVFRDQAVSEITLHCYSRQLSAGPDNLVWRAAELLKERSGCKRGVHIRLVKRIPMAAGLAGGSTDAAATLLGLNRLWQLGLSDADLATLSAELGSDIPFFFHLPAAWCTGRGEIATPLELGTPLDFVLLCPAFGMPTAAVYKKVSIQAPPVSGDAIRLAIEKGDVDSVGRFMHNRLQQAAESLEPRIAEYAQMLADAAPAGQMMSGSGSTLFALCRSSEDAQRVAAKLKTRSKARDYRIIVTRSL